MFTGIIEELGIAKNIKRKGDIFLLEVISYKTSGDVRVGDSIAVNGVCLTLIDKKNNNLFFEIMPYTYRNTNLGLLRFGDRVNLERALRLGERISGHFILGHIDCLGIIRRKGYEIETLFFEISIPPSYIKYCVTKGSVAIDGISLTIAKVKSNSFYVNIIPYTLNNTNLNFRKISDRVNIEFDILVKKSYL